MGAGEALGAVQLRLPVPLLVLADVVIDFPCAGEGVFYGADGFIPDFQLLPLAGKLPVDGGSRLIQPGRKGRPVADQLGGGPAHPVGKFVQGVQQRGLFPPVLQNPGFVLVALVELG